MQRLPQFLALVGEDAGIRRFAKRVAGWMDDHLDRFETDGVPLFVAPRFLGELRKLYGPGLAKRVQEFQADLTQLTEASLAKHRAVADLVGHDGD